MAKSFDEMLEEDFQEAKKVFKKITGMDFVVPNPTFGRGDENVLSNCLAYVSTTKLKQVLEEQKSAEQKFQDEFITGNDKIKGM
jgi:hypothetical protein